MATLANGKELGAYTIVRLIGRGGMGEVYEAYEHRLQRRVALKVISPQKADVHGENELVRRFMQEARTLAQVNHPNVVTIYSIDKIGDVQFIAMEYVDGCSFKDLFTYFAMSADEAAPIFLQLLEGLRTLHDNKILHRDLKPHNIMIRPNGQVKILDFGIAKRLNDRDRENTTAGVVVGTLAYLPPEVLYGTPATVRSDLWSLGAIFYECMVGQPLVSMHSVKVKGVRAATDSDVVFPQESVGWIPTEMRLIVGKLSDRKPDNRYASATEVIESIKFYQSQRPRLAPEALRTFFNVVGDFESYKKQNETKKPASPKAKRESMLTLLNGRAMKAESAKFPPEGDQPSQVEITKDSISARRKAQRAARTFRRREWLIPGVGAVLSLILILAVAVKVVNQKKKDAKPDAAAEAFKLLAPVGDQALWLDPTQIPTLTWSKIANPGDYELQIATDQNFNTLVVHEEANGTSYRPGRVMDEGDYYWQLWPIRSALKPIGPEHFTISTVQPLDLHAPKPDQVFELPRGEKDVAINFRWHCKPGAKSYRVQITSDEKFGSVEREEMTELCAWNEVALSPGNYFWRVRVEDPPKLQETTLAKQSFSVKGDKRAAPSAPLARSLSAPRIKMAHQSVTLQLREGAQGRDVASLRKQLTTVPVLSWQPVRGARGYSLQISWNSEFTKLLSEENIATSSFNWNQAIPGHFFWRVRAGGEAGSPFSSSGQVDVTLPEPKLNAAYTLTDGASLDWKPSPFAEKYIVQFSPQRNMASVTEKTTSEPSVPIEMSEKDGPIYVRIAAANATGERVSGYSQVATVSVEEAVKMMAPNILTPPRGARVVVGKTGRISVVFTWSKVDKAQGYVVQISNQADFAKILQERSTKSSHWLLKGAKFNGKVFWRVRSDFASGQSDWGKPGFFEVR